MCKEPSKNLQLAQMGVGVLEAEALRKINKKLRR